METNKLLTFIEELSIKDKKTLSQKVLKTVEEVGELSKVVLPFENADGTVHRFSDKNKILEEVADVLLTSISIAYSLDFTNEEIKDMLYEKAVKWQHIQSKEQEINKNSIPFEIHITVKLPEERICAELSNIDYFKQSCASLKVKPIVLDLENPNGNMIDVMTSSHFLGDNVSAYFEMIYLTRQLRAHNFDVVREKIETVPWHPAAPSELNHVKKMPENCYFESHIGVVINNESEKEILKVIAESCDAHLSRNFFKKNQDGSYINMVTLRKYDDTYEGFKKDHDNLVKYIEHKLVINEKPIVEFAIFDSKVSHDFNWLKAKEYSYDSMLK